MCTRLGKRVQTKILAIYAAMTLINTKDQSLGEDVVNGYDGKNAVHVFKFVEHKLLKICVPSPKLRTQILIL